ncbi:TPA: hypothetical protein ACGCAJ_004715 [Serratia marcescens]
MADHINLDYESRSRVNLKTAGFDRYSGDSSTQILMGAWSINDGPVQHWDGHRGKKMPGELRDALEDPQVLKWAFNAQFERVMTRRVLNIKTDYNSWRCTMALAYMLGFSGDLLSVGTAIGLPEHLLKDTDGKRLIDMFSKPQRVTKKNPFEWRNESTDPDDWWGFCGYNKQDVTTELAIKHRLQKYPVLQSEWDMYALDQYINDTGVMIDTDFARAAIELAEQRKPLIMEEMRDITGLSNPNSPTQLLGWLKERGYPFNDLRSDTVAKVVREAADLDIDPEVPTVLEMRLNSAKSSLSKYSTMLAAAGTDGRFRYSLQFAGASRTNRWAGRRIQTQNLPRTPKLIEDVTDLTIVNKMIHDRDLDALTLYVGEPMNALVGCIRSAFVPTPGHKFIVADLSSIESVVIGWITNCRWFLDTLAIGHDLYRSFAAHWLKLAYEDTKPHRPKAKPATLGAGYRLGGGHMDENGKKTGLWGYAENMGVHMTQAEAEESVRAFRELCPEIVQAWYDLENAVFRVIRTKQPVEWGCLVIEYNKPFLTIRLPSGRKMYYFRPRIVERQMTVQKGPKKGQKYVKSNFQYEGKLDGTNKWGKIYSHGGKLVENIVQALARDVLAEGLKKAHRMGFRIVMHIHDEIVTEVPEDSELTVDDLITCMAAELPWAPGLPLGAAGWEGYFYRKD